MKTSINDYNNRKRKETGFAFVCINNPFVDSKLINTTYPEKVVFFFGETQRFEFFQYFNTQIFRLRLKFFFW